jgi:alkanesulfonate monooxygenase SsuD/methylene tetrahydromethanopterin reductase-like flavin-dependent oxidoreductase (luciferase family)
LPLNFAPDYLQVASELYRHQFQPRDELAESHLMIGVQVIVAETDEEPRRLFTTPPATIPAPHSQPAGRIAAASGFDARTLDCRRARRRRKPAWRGYCRFRATVKAGLEKLLDETGAGELIVVTNTYEPRARSESYRRLAQIGAEIEFPENSPTHSVATRHRST